MTSASDNLATLVDDMLQDAGCGQDAELRDALLSLGTMASLPVPAPSGKLAALLASGAPSAGEERDSGEPAPGHCREQPSEQPHAQPSDEPQDELARRRRRHRPTALGIVLVAGMGLGVGGVAASTTTPGGSAIGQLLEEWAPWSHHAADPSAAGDAAAGSADYHAPNMAAAGETASTAAPAGAADAANLASRLLPGHAGLSGRTNLPPCTGPVRHEAGTGTAKCGATGDNGASGAAAQGNGAGSGKDSAGPAGVDGTVVAPSPPGAEKAEPPAANTSPGVRGTTGAGGQKPGGSTDNAGQPAQGQSPGGSPGNAQKGASPAK